ncbi:4-alpha-glucanotransferase [Naumannella halotolerans]|uniref:4-alpha-glucanotransferase n=1 Tax=Naumannella halotolerans TaxID=993414 RepID=A0A4R7J991_9ACTN|nr:4-alpha-glucanotransferase [Naumannella halotolerans]TDT34082.1 4-alpha-glucanotransferase [Naumannella halotolerans]
MTTAARLSPLQRLATAHGVAVEYEDWRQVRQQVSDQTLVAVLADLDVDAASDAAIEAALAAEASDDHLSPVVVIAEQGGTAGAPVGATAELRTEQGERIALGIATDGIVDLPAGLPLGYHRLHLSSAGRQLARMLLVAPQVIPTPPELVDGRLWGSATQLYSTPSQRSWGIGDFDDLARLARWSAADHGAGFVLVNPLQAGSVTVPFEPSPYLPSSRRFTDPIYLAIDQLPGFAELDPDARAAMDALAEQARTGLGELIDRDRIWPAKLAALRILFDHVGTEVDGFAEFRRERGQALIDFATWCALVQRHGGHWRDWPQELRRPRTPQVESFVAESAAEIDFWCWVQFCCDSQLARAQQQAVDAGMALGVMHDLAVGVHPDGADAWALGEVFADHCRVGAPPDAFNQLGQDWGQHPLRPDRLVQTDYAPFREMVHAILSHAGGLRIDHAMGMFRLWWVPGDQGPDQGTYVHYDSDMMLGILALEAARAGAVIVGEDLGTVEPQVRTELAARGVYGTSILWFEQDWDAGVPLPPQAWRRDCLAAVTTHDLPPTQGYLAGAHIDLRDRLGLLTVPKAKEEQALAADVQRWRTELHALGLLPSIDADDEELSKALHTFLGLTPSRLLCVSVADLVGERRAQNQPGTSNEYPNWRIPLGDAAGEPVTLDQLFVDPQANELAEIMRMAANRRPVES